jgi:flagellin-like protein
MKKLSFEIPDRDERGVSPVIGVILMVAITVILAAVIASFVLGFGDSVQNNVQAGADISENEDGNVSVTWISEGNADHLNVSADGTQIPANAESLSEVGDTLSLNSTDPGSGTFTVVVTAVGESGARTVVAQKDVNIE